MSCICAREDWQRRLPRSFTVVENDMQAEKLSQEYCSSKLLHRIPYAGNEKLEVYHEQFIRRFKGRISVFIYPVAQYWGCLRTSTSKRYDVVFPIDVIPPSSSFLLPPHALVVPSYANEINILASRAALTRSKTGPNLSLSLHRHFCQLYARFLNYQIIFIFSTPY